MSTHGRHSRNDHRWLPAILLALLVGGMTAAAGAIGWNIAADKAAEQPADLPAGSGVPSGTSADDVMPSAGTSPSVTSPGTTPTTTELEECRSLWASQVKVELAGDASLDQWRLHIDAMNQLVAGEITLEQATQYWNDTRRGAHARAEAFRALDADLGESTQRCANTETGSESASGPVDKCVTATNAFAKSLAAARIAMTSWEHHIRDMDLFRAGKITAQQATSMWLESWQTGADQLATYDRRAAHALEQDCA
ncbi:MAG: hypothetical protein H0V23_07370 [Nocardioidaceae bacterium]|nr:hypothetical protein [Nocardioidaceae bacterium]